MRYFASIDANNICTGIQQSDGEVIADNVIEVTATVIIGTPIADFLWRKYEDGLWSVEKFIPPEPEPTPSPEKVEIEQLKVRLATAEQSAAETSLTLQELLESLYA